jgi:hypothetical protein
MESRKLVKKSKEELRDWALIYEPIAKKVVDTFEKTLHIRKAQLLNEIVGSIDKYSDVTTAATSSSSSSDVSKIDNVLDKDLDSFYKTLANIPIAIYSALGDSGFDGVFISSSLIDPISINYHYNNRNSQAYFKSIKRASIRDFYLEVKGVAASFSA